MRMPKQQEQDLRQHHHYHQQHQHQHQHQHRYNDDGEEDGVKDLFSNTREEVVVEEGDIVDAHVGGDKWVRGVVLAVPGNGFVSIRFESGNIDRAVPVQVLRVVEPWMEPVGSGNEDDTSAADHHSMTESLEASLGGGMAMTLGSTAASLQNHPQHQETQAHLSSIKEMLERVLDSLQWEMVREKLDAHTEQVTEMMKGHHSTLQETLKGHHDKLDHLHKSIPSSSSSHGDATAKGGSHHGNHKKVHPHGHGKKGGKKKSSHNHGTATTSSSDSRVDRQSSSAEDFEIGETCFVTYRGEVVAVNADGTFKVGFSFNHGYHVDGGVSRDMLIPYEMPNTPTQSDLAPDAPSDQPEVESDDASRAGQILGVDTLEESEEERHMNHAEDRHRAHSPDKKYDSHQHQQQHMSSSPTCSSPNQSRSPNPSPSPSKGKHSKKGPPPASSSGASKGFSAADLVAHTQSHDGKHTGHKTRGRRGSVASSSGPTSPLDVLDERDPLMMATKSRRRSSVSSIMSIALDGHSGGTRANKGRRNSLARAQLDLSTKLSTPVHKVILQPPAERPSSAPAAKEFRSVTKLLAMDAQAKAKKKKSKATVSVTKLAESYGASVAGLLM